MFWKKKHMEAEIVSPGATTAATPSATKVEATLQPKAGKTKVEKSPGPRQIPGLVGKHLTDNYQMDAELVRILKIVVHKRPQTERTFNCRIFDQSEAEAKEVEIEDYTSLDGNPELILYEGWFDEDSKKVELTEKKKVSFDVPLFTETEIRQKIEALSEPGSTAFFYQAAGPGRGGPLGMGAAVIELNPNYPAKKGKKYIIYTVNVINMQPVGKGQKLYGSDKPKEIAKWVAQGHHKRMY